MVERMEEEPVFEEPTLVELGTLWDLTLEPVPPGKTGVLHDASPFALNRSSS
jgi:hypothetical protein